MLITLEQQIAEYKEKIEVVSQDGRALRQRLESQGWTLLEEVFDYDGFVMVSPTLTNHQDWSLAFFDDEYDWWNLEEILRLNSFSGNNDWSDHIVEIAVAK